MTTIAEAITALRSPFLRSSCNRNDAMGFLFGVLLTRMGAWALGVLLQAQISVLLTCSV